MDKKAVAIVVGGGPAPGINGVISAVTIEAIKRGHKVYGIISGFSRIMTGDSSCLKELSIDDVSRIHREGGAVLGTSRANPTKNPEHLEAVVSVLKQMGVGYLVTIGGDDTAHSASCVSEKAGDDILVGHVPKTIDNDLPLPGNRATFGYHTARHGGTYIVETLMTDAKTTERWYFATAMGRKAGHLALGIGVAAGASVAIIPEELEEDKVPMKDLVDILAGSILKRRAHGRYHGVAVLAEGLVEKIDPSSMPELDGAERDPHGHIRYAEVDLGRALKKAVRNRLVELGVDITIVDKNIGYELRCHPPIPFDQEYTRQLGYGVIVKLLGEGAEGMIARSDDLEIIPFEQLRDPETGVTKVRLVDTHSLTYRVARNYMIRLSTSDLENEEFLGQMAEVTNLSPAEVKAAFAESAAKYSTPHVKG